ncbi:hypothetical protein LX32DRAFT_282628 [Colletotrichum zoysiae]|uniref:Uncharacterized protein n=1 Tax=Colletotrichum zoysiae TaxID=1216348 RepID=A0AAD9LUJ2_9PEZI|nr:hypothetical protein LX32DRAFT_282628 [Colletotrichum zoysiae]
MIALREGRWMGEHPPLLDEGNRGRIKQPDGGNLYYNTSEPRKAMRMSRGIAFSGRRGHATSGGVGREEVSKQPGKEMGVVGCRHLSRANELELPVPGAVEPTIPRAHDHKLQSTSGLESAVSDISDTLAGSELVWSSPPSSLFSQSPVNQALHKPSSC